MAPPRLETVLLDLSSEGILTITLNRPKLKNAWNEQQVRSAFSSLLIFSCRPHFFSSSSSFFHPGQFNDVRAALIYAKGEEDVHVVMLTGTGDYFSSGAELGPSGLDLTAVEMRDAPSARFMWELMHFPKPVIALVNGPAVGIAFTILPHCDIVYCTKDAFFWAPFSRAGVSSSVFFRSP